MASLLTLHSQATKVVTETSCLSYLYLIILCETYLQPLILITGCIWTHLVSPKTTCVWEKLERSF